MTSKLVCLADGWLFTTALNAAFSGAAHWVFGWNFFETFLCAHLGSVAQAAWTDLKAPP